MKKKKGPFYLDLQLGYFQWKNPYIQETANARKKANKTEKWQKYSKDLKVNKYIEFRGKGL